MENKTVCLRYDKKELRIPYGARLSDYTLTNSPCGGHGKCGKCKAYVTGYVSELTSTEKSHLTSDEIADGIRMLCMTYALGDLSVRSIRDSGSLLILTDAMPHVAKSSTAALAHAFTYGVALDVGTTTLAARLYAEDGTLLSECGRENPQSRYGQDVISRIEAALSDADALAECIRGGIDALLYSLAKEADVSPSSIDRLVITGNTAMLYLLTKTSVEPLSHAPFAANRLFDEEMKACALGLRSVHPDTTVYLPPIIASYVGADTVTAILASGMLDRRENAVLADVGTNGEIALLVDGRLSVCSTAAGPAFEGVGIQMGMRAESGAIDSVRLMNGTLACHTLGEVSPVGICGSGLIDAVACLLDLGELDETGRMDTDEISLSDHVVLTNRDVRMLQLAKSAIFSGISTLIARSGSAPSQLSQLYLAGGFGSYLQKHSAVRIGLIPRELGMRATSIGNAALEGATMLLLDEGARAAAQRIARSAVHIELATDPMFAELYMMNMSFPE